MKICYVGDARACSIQDIAKCLTNEGHEVHIISFYPARVEGVFIHCIDSHRLVQEKYLYMPLPLKLIEIKKIIKWISPDIVHGIVLTDHGLCAAFSDFHPLIEAAWGSDVLVLPHESYIHKLQMKYTVSRADFITATSKYLATKVAQYVPNTKRIFTMPLGVDLSKFTPRVKKSSETIIGVVKNLAKTSGIEYLILALPRVLKEFPEIKVEMYGRGDHELQYLQLIKKLNLNYVVQYHGFIPHDYIPDRLNRMTLLVMPSLSESFGVAALEAQAMQLPVIATNVGGLPEVVQNGITGILVNPKCPNEISNAIIKLLRNEKLREEMGIKGRMYVSKEYEQHKTIKNILNIYHEILDK